MNYVTQIRLDGRWVDMTYHNSPIAAAEQAESMLDDHDIVRVIRRLDTIIQQYEASKP